MITSIHTLRTEVRYLDAADPKGDFRIFHPREGDLEYSVDHHRDTFFIRTNDGGRNFRLMETPIGETGRESWSEVISHREDTLLEGFTLFDDYLVLSERTDGLVKLRVRPWKDEGAEHIIKFGEETYDAGVHVNRNLASKTFRYWYTSLATPPQVVDYDMKSGERVVIKQEEVLGGFDSKNYQTNRLMIRARDGVQVPVSLVHRKGLAKNGKSPLLLYAYGSYGSSTDASFSASILSLLDRGFAYAIAHIRGGQEMGYDWYENGKLLKKKNTFTDFIDVAEALIGLGYTQSDRLIGRGGSAGGLLMGAISNMRPDLWRGLVAHVPFVDVISTMIDETIPLTTFEWDEWGNPNDKVYYDYMLSYSPYDQVEKKDYPAMLITAGLHDSQVQYWEPAKWVARLRDRKTDRNLLLLKTHMEAGHGGASGRYSRYRETALEYAFMLDLLR